MAKKAHRVDILFVKFTHNRLMVCNKGVRVCPLNSLFEEADDEFVFDFEISGRQRKFGKLES